MNVPDAAELHSPADEIAAPVASGLRSCFDERQELGAVVHWPREASDGTTGVTEVDVRAMLGRAKGYEPSVVEGRFMIHAVHMHRPWIVIVEPDVDAKLLVVVTPYEVSV